MTELEEARHSAVMRQIPEARFWLGARLRGLRAAFTGITLGAIWLAGCGATPSTPYGMGGAAAGAGAGAGGGAGTTPEGSGGTIPTSAAGTGGTEIVITGGSSGVGGTLVVTDGGTAGLTSGLYPPGIGVPSGSIVCDDGPAAERDGGVVGDAGAPATSSPFCAQMVWNAAPAHRVLYSWTTPEQVEELRRDRVLLTRTETAGLGRGYAFTSIDELAARGNAPENQLLAKLSGELFSKVRYAWPNAWATRMGWPGEDYGDQLLRVVLKPEAWIVVVSDRVGMAVIDLNNEVVPIEQALAESHRIGAVYFYKVDIQGQDTFSSCSGGYREFILGNEAMVEEWSLGTAEIRDQLEADATLIEDFLEEVRVSPPALSPSTFNEVVACQWDYRPSTVVDTYLRCLSMPSENYTPLPAQLAAMAEALRAGSFEPDPLVVAPGG